MCAPPPRARRACCAPLTHHSPARAADLEQLIAIVPAKFYLPPDPDEMAKRFQKHVGKPAAGLKHQRKLEANERKKERLDPGKQLSAVQQQQLAAQQASATKARARARRPPKSETRQVT